MAHQQQMLARSIENPRRGAHMTRRNIGRHPGDSTSQFGGIAIGVHRTFGKFGQQRRMVTGDGNGGMRVTHEI